ncbi:hypothetical protein [Bosea psychrotolerans]|uniref:Uncharacterized protein n=1 Tax=Bosea psychrotolerans TaxID=1871628 RepID=A0A2S4M885_9HYPH|nr:hypothetical protein [Bosea psychrotolerans]POR50871.1 hypothetical protein CYD53_108119 [Bosea psychrotolerans]
MTLQQRVRIHTEDDHERATQRIDEIAHASAGSREEAELLALLEAVERWESHQDCWSDWL